MEILSVALLVTDVAGCAFLLQEAKIQLTSKEQAKNRLVNREMIIAWISRCKITRLAVYSRQLTTQLPTANRKLEFQVSIK
jgi:hypothetical protein